MDIQVTGYENEEASKSLTLEITPMYRKVATTVDPTGPSFDGESIKVKGDEGVAVEEANAVELDEGELAVKGKAVSYTHLRRHRR